MSLQTFDEKCEAVISLLGFVLYHLDRVPGAARTARQEWESERSDLDEPPRRPAVYDYCDGRCAMCHAKQCPPDEAWVRTRNALRRRYRIAAVTDSLMRLATVHPLLAQAVWCVWVEPSGDPKTEPISARAREERGYLAAEGVRWMAGDIPGEVVGFGEKPEPLDNEIALLLSYGNAVTRIMKKLHVGHERVKRVQERVVGGTV